MELEKDKQAWLELLKGTGATGASEEWRVALMAQIAGADTASELAAGVAQHLHKLYQTYGKECLALILKGLSPTVWAEAGILVNPRTIPGRGSKDLCVVGDGTVPTEQWIWGAVTYYGDVRLSVFSGTAHVVDTRYPIQADSEAIVFAYGSDSVNAAGAARVWLHDRARCEASGDVHVQAFDRSYVQAVVGRPWISAHDEAQCFVRTPRATVSIDDYARGVIQCDEVVSQAMQVHVAGSGVLYLDVRSQVDLQVKAGDFQGLILQSSKVRMGTDEVCELLIPRRSTAAAPYAAPLREPMEVERLKQELQPYLPDELPSSAYQLFENSKDEREVGAFVQRHLTEMAAYGLNGDFLRSHFTQATLTALHIHTARGCEAANEPGPHFFFGDQLVYANRFQGGALGFDQALVIANAEAHPSHTYQYASAITLGGSLLFAHNNSRVLGKERSKIYAYHGTKATVQDHCSCDAYDHAQVAAYDKAIVLGYHQSRLALHYKCYAEVNDRCRAWMEECGQVIVRNEGSLSYLDDGRIKPEQIEVQSDDAEVNAFTDRSQFERYKESFALESNHSVGRGVR